MLNTRPLLFNIFVNDLFLFVLSSFLSNYAVDKFMLLVLTWEKTRNILRIDFDAVKRWFYENYITLNTVKCQFMCLWKETLIFKDLVTKNSKEQKILEVTIDNKLNCKSHIKELCKKVSQKASQII